MSTLAKVEPSVSMVTRSSLFFFWLSSKVCWTDNHTDTHRFLSPYSFYLLCSPTLHHPPLLFLILKDSLSAAASRVPSSSSSSAFWLMCSSTLYKLYTGILQDVCCEMYKCRIKSIVSVWIHECVMTCYSFPSRSVFMLFVGLFKIV